MRGRWAAPLVAVLAAGAGWVLHHYYGVCLKYCGGPPWWSSPTAIVVGIVAIVIAILAVIALIRRSQRL